MDVVTGTEQAWNAIVELLRALDDAEWKSPTACEEWDVRAMAAHLGGIEGSFMGFPQPEPPDGWSSRHEGSELWTATGIAARDDWTREQVLDEVERAAAARVAQLRAATTEADWEKPAPGPFGETTLRDAANIRVYDVYTHLLDMRFGLGCPLDLDREPAALEVAASRAVNLTPWGAAKKAKLPDGARVRLELSGPAPVCTDVVVDGGRAALVAPSRDASDVVEGHLAAYLLLVSGRDAVADTAGGVRAKGDAATALLENYRFFS